jgi:hypothetical protein
MKTKCFIISLLSFYFIGCGPMIGMLKEPTFTSSNKLNITDPLKVDISKVQSVKKIALINIYDYAKSEQKIHPDTIRMFNAMIEELRSDLKASGRFEIITPLTFKKKSQELDLLSGNIYVMNDDDFAEETAKVGNALKCDGVLILNQKQQKVEMGKAVVAVMFVGTMDVPVTSTLKLVDSKNGKTLWYQESDYTLNMGQMALANIPEEDLRKNVSPIIRPLSNDFLKAFAVTEVTGVVSPARIEEIKPITSTYTPSKETNENKDLKTKTAASEVTTPPAAPSPQYLVVIKSANLRVEANNKSKIIMTLKKGERVEYLSKSGNWFNIKLSTGVTGWVIKDLVTEEK